MIDALDRRRLHERVRAGGELEEGFDLASQRFVTAARLAQERRARLALVARERVVIQPLDVLPAVGIDHAITWRKVGGNVPPRLSVESPQFRR